eukprot:3876175-Amphidinium_carterae.1
MAPQRVRQSGSSLVIWAPHGAQMSGTMRDALVADYSEDLEVMFYAALKEKDLCEGGSAVDGGAEQLNKRPLVF